jgi:hypothetical protein
MDIKPIIKEENIVERQDLEKIEEINSIIAEIQKKLDSKDYKTAVLSQYVKPVHYVWVSLPELNIYLTPIRSGIEGHFGRKDYKEFKAPYILLHNSRFKRNKILFDENGMAHELQHYIDWKKGNKFTDFKNILKPEGGINPEYYNDPTEWSAYVIQFLRQYFQAVPLKKLAQDFQSFYKDFWRKTEAKDYYKTLTSENKKKF